MWVIMHIFNQLAKDLAMLQMSPNKNNIEEFYLYLHDEYQIANAEIENMRFDLQWMATPERLQIINSHRIEFQEYLQELISMDKFIDDLTNNASDHSIQCVCVKCKELCSALQKLARKVILKVNHAEANLIVCNNQLPTLH